MNDLSGKRFYRQNKRYHHRRKKQVNSLTVEPVECVICLEKALKCNEIFTLQCNHSICSICTKRSLDIAIEDKKKNFNW